MLHNEIIRFVHFWIRISCWRIPHFGIASTPYGNLRPLQQPRKALDYQRISLDDYSNDTLDVTLLMRRSDDPMTTLTDSAAKRRATMLFVKLGWADKKYVEHDLKQNWSIL